MPNKDGTGPKGKGARTGRQMGNCKRASPIERGQCDQRLQRGLGRRFANRQQEE